ncbi:MAG: TIR domain-containing protein, partial [Phycisphaerae bacterium]|nr:TIR domain-containing protein [Phycisphaerae bacterium]
MPNQDYQFDAFLSHAGEDTPWCEQLAERLRNKGVRVWFDKWRLQPGHNLDVELNNALETSKKMIAVWSAHYFRKTWTQLEAFSKHHDDPLSADRPVIPVCIENRDALDIPPTLRPILSLDFTNDADYDLRLHQLIEALDLPKREPASERAPELREHDIDPRKRGRDAYRAGKRFEDEVAALYRLLGFDVTPDTQISGVQIDLQIKKREGGLTTEAVVECKDKRITATERDQILAQQNVVQKKFPKLRWIAVSSQGFAAETRVALEEAGIDCITYPELLHGLVPLDTYVDHLIADVEDWIADPKNWDGRDLFIRPDIVTDVTYERRAAMAHLAEWLGKPDANLLAVLGDLGTGKTTLARFLAYQMARSFRDDPLRHPAPVLIPLREVRKEVALDSIVVKHFRDRGLPGVNYQRFDHLVRQGKVVLFFDAFDEMADRVRWDVTQSNFQELRRAADGDGKVILTCRTHYFKDRQEQARLIGQGPSLTAAETALYKELRQQSNAEVVYLQEFSEVQIQEYLRRTRGDDADADWLTIRRIYNLRDLAQRPLLLDMIVKSLPRLDPDDCVNAANLYTVYTNLWVERDYRKGRVVLTQETKLALMMELAWWMWQQESGSITTKDLVAFVAKLQAAGAIEFGDEEVDDIAREVQTASFLRRDHDGNFSFMHRSFGEFFLARRILSSLQPSEAKPEDAVRSALNTRRLDRKVIYFLTLLDENDALLAPLRDILITSYTPNASENALQVLYWSGRVHCDMEEEIEDAERLRRELAKRIPPGAQLAGAQLQEIVLERAVLKQAHLAEANLTEANLNGVRLLRCNLAKADLRKAKAQGLLAEHVDFRKSDLGGMSLGNARLTHCDLTGASCDPAQFATATVQHVRGIHLPGTVVRDELVPVVQAGSPSAVQAVAWSQDADLLAVGGSDGIVRLYRAADGRLLRTLEGHRDWVRSVAFDPRGRALASGSDDNTVKLWDTET